MSAAQRAHRRTLKASFDAAFAALLEQARLEGRKDAMDEASRLVLFHGNGEAETREQQLLRETLASKLRQIAHAAARDASGRA